MKEKNISSNRCQVGDRKRLGQVIRQLREEAGLRQEDLALGISKSESTVSKIETGSHPLDYDVLIRIAHVLKISPLRLFWMAQRSLMIDDPGRAKMVPVFDALLASLDAADTPEE